MSFISPMCLSLRYAITILALVSLLSNGLLLPVWGEQDPLVRKTTGLKYIRKAWWARRISSDIYTSGRLTDRQVRYAVDAGFASVLMVWDFQDAGVFGIESQPNARDVRYLIQDVSNLGYGVVFSPGESYTTLQQLARFRERFEALPRPILVTCRSSVPATFLVLASLAQRTKEGNASPSNGYPEIDATRFFHIASVFGINFNTEQHRPLIISVTGEERLNNPAKPSDVSRTRRRTYVYPIYGNWYVAGQIGQGHAKLFGEIGFKTIVNNRRGVVTNGQRSQEEAFLINILDDTGTYTDGGRQTIARLEATRIEPNRPNAFISESSPVNYEASNVHEFGDNIGYNETLERLEVERVDGLNYINLPIYYELISPAWYSQHTTELITAAKRGPVLVHCASGLRASVLCAADEHNKDLHWAEQKLWDLGFTLNGLGRELYEHVLPVDAGTTPGLATNAASLINHVGIYTDIIANVGKIIVKYLSCLL